MADTFKTVQSNTLTLLCRDSTESKDLPYFFLRRSNGF